MTKQFQVNECSIAREGEILENTLLRIAWRQKYVFIIIFFIMLLLSTLYLFYARVEFQSTITVKEAEKSGLSSSGMLSKYAQLGALAGIDLPTGGDGEMYVALEKLSDWGFVEKFIDKYDLAALVYAAKSWDSQAGKVIFDSSIYNASEGIFHNPDTKPSSWELYEKFIDSLEVYENDKTGMIKISFSHVSPAFAKRCLDLLIFEINKQLSEEAKTQAENKIKFINQKIGETQVAEIRVALSEILQGEYQKLIIAYNATDFIFRVVNHPKVAEKKHRPKVFLVLLAGMTISILLYILYLYITIARFQMVLAKK